jgi:DNA-binding NtrC family response regulator
MAFGKKNRAKPAKTLIFCNLLIVSGSDLSYQRSQPVRIGTMGRIMKAHTILVVDDEPIIRMALADHLQDKGFVVLQAETADQAIVTLCEVRCPVDLVFTDVRMPGTMDGLGLSKWVLENRPGIPVIIASGDMGKAVALDDLCGAQAIAKPFNYDHVSEKIAGLIKARHAAQN